MQCVVLRIRQKNGFKTETELVNWVIFQDTFLVSLSSQGENYIQYQNRMELAKLSVATKLA